jgi:sulfite reductase (NADPH) flavoprotein alpha-component
MLAAAGLRGRYLAMCGALWHVHASRRRAMRRAASGLAEAAGAPLLVAYASQTGHAEELARQSAQALHDAGVASPCAAAVGAQRGPAAPRAACAVRRQHQRRGRSARQRLALRAQPAAAGAGAAELHYGLLALGDRRYARFCGFGHALGSWLERSGARRCSSGSRSIGVTAGARRLATSSRGLAGIETAGAWQAALVRAVARRACAVT